MQDYINLIMSLSETTQIITVTTLLCTGIVSVGYSLYEMLF